MRKKIFIICAALMAVLCAAPQCMAGDRVSVYCGDFPVRFESEPFTDKGVALVPLRDVCAALGAHLEWYSETQDMVVRYDEREIHLKIGSDVLKREDGEVRLPAAPRLIGGRTYVPLSVFSKGFQKQLKWDMRTSEARLILEQKTVVVSTVEELINAVQPDTRIVMKPGIYNLSEADWSGTSNPIYMYRFDVYGGGSQLAAYGVSNLSIVGNGSEIVTNSGYADVLKFVDCRMISISGLKIGHLDAGADCTGDVLDFRQCQSVNIENSQLYGSGSYGIVAADTKGLRMNGSAIEDCAKGMVNLSDSEDFLFNGLSLNNCSGFNMIDMKSCREILFDGCSFVNNSGRALFGGKNGTGLVFRRCSFSGNVFSEGNRASGTDVSARFENIPEGKRQ